MPTYKDIRTLARSLVGQVTESGESWKAFLDSAAYTYNYAFPNQLLIFSQRPDATAVASIDYWNNKALRWVNRGSHGIALLDSHSNRGKLRYVFDIADTHGREYVPQAMPWMVDNTNRQRVWEALKQTADADTVQNAIALRAATQAAEHRTQISRLLESTISGSTLEWRRREEQQKMLEKLVAQSAAYMMAKRCGIDTALLETDAFATVSEFDTDAIAVVLGSLTSQVSRPVLQSLGSLVRQIDSVALACKHRSSVKKQKAKYKTTTTSTSGKTVPCLQVVVERPGKKPLVATWGGISLAHKRKAVIEDKPYKVYGGRTELIKRLTADTCELCGSRKDIEVHHIRKLADLKTKGKSAPPPWVRIMAARQRKTLVVCRECHTAIHNGTLNTRS